MDVNVSSDVTRMSARVNPGHEPGQGRHQSMRWVDGSDGDAWLGPCSVNTKGEGAFMLRFHQTGNKLKYAF